MVIKWGKKGKALGCEPSLSPDGKRIAFHSVRKRGEKGDIWILNMENETQIQLTKDPSEDYGPSFSPDGKKVIFHSDRTGNFDI